MTNNDVFKTLLHLTGIGRDKELIVSIFKRANVQATHSKIKGWRTSLDNPRASRMPDAVLEAFFQGLFDYRDEQLCRGIQVFNFTSSST